MKRFKLLNILFLVSISVFAQYKSEFKLQTLLWNNNINILTPDNKAKNAPWLLKFENNISSIDSILLKRGFSIVYYNNREMDLKKQHKQINEFIQYICNSYKLSTKPTIKIKGEDSYSILGWASNNPEKITSIYIDSLITGTNNESEIKNILSKLKNANIPIIGKNYSQQDYKSLKIIYETYSNLGGVIQITNNKIKYEERNITDDECIADFIIRHRQEYKNLHHINLRSNLNNSFYRFQKEKKGCVAFLGGSITEMTGWRNMIKTSLQQRFPDTEFKFIEVGIGSTGSTPHAFRFENDVLKQGIPDLLFVEAAVNDHTNRFGPTEQVRGMEGIVRHARKSNPNIDIIMLHFIYAPFIKPMQMGILPDVVMNHERVANYYNIPSINLIQEIVERMDRNEFTWKDFGGTHPVWDGHKYYAAAINHLFDINLRPISELKIAQHFIPKEPLDKFCYADGHFIDIKDANLIKGFHYISQWNPSNNIEKRKGFVNVPVLETKESGATLSLDFSGKAIGIFCISGPNAGVLEYSVDNAPYKEVDTYTIWSKDVYLPWVYMLETELSDGNHKLFLRIKDTQRNECQIRNFVVNGSNIK